MKKLMLMGVVGCLCAGVASADIFVRFDGLSGFYRSDDTTLLLAEQGGGPEQALVQFIYTPNMDYTPNGTVQAGNVDADEVILHSFTMDDTTNNDWASFTVTDPSSDAFAAGWVYARIFDVGTATAGDVAADEWYYDSPLYATVDNNTVNPTVLDAQGASPSGAFAGADFLYKQVPEPATFALMGLGGLALAIRRRLSA